MPSNPRHLPRRTLRRAGTTVLLLALLSAADGGRDIDAVGKPPAPS